MLEPNDLIELLSSLQARANSLLEELSTFQEFLRTQNRQDSVEIRHFRNNVQSEVKSLSRVSVSDAGDNSLEPEDEEREAKRLHILHSTNLPFYEAVWSAAKQCRGVVALGKRMHWVPSMSSDRSLSAMNRAASSKIDELSAQKKSVLIDVIADDGLEWVKVSTVTTKRLLFEIAKEGWEKYANSEESDSEDSLEKPDLKLIRLARDLYEASLQTRVRYLHPRVRLLLPKVMEGENVDVEAILQDLRKSSVLVECGGHRELNGSESQELTMSAHGKFQQMLPNLAIPLTSILNVDCTLLLALISDISHVIPSALPDPPLLKNTRQSYHSSIIRQISAEESSPLLPTELYPVLVGSKLVCTTQAAKRACEIVETMGTATERMRAGIFLGLGGYAKMSEQDLRRALQQDSVHPVPDGLCINIAQVEFEPTYPFRKASSDPDYLRFPAVIAKRVVEKMGLSLINSSVFLYGWRENIVTVTSNQAVAGRLVQTINSVLDDQYRAAPGEDPANLQQQDFRGPRIWLCGTARSLIGKSKGKSPAS